MKGRTKKFAVIALILAMCLSLMACTQTAISPSESTPQTRTVQDSNGNDIEIPYNVERVCPRIGAFSQITAMLGEESKIVASVTTLSDMFKTVFPDFGNMEGRASNNVEDIIAAGAQVAYGPNYSQDQIDQMNAAGIAVITLDSFSNAEELKGCVRTIAEILGGDALARAEVFCEYYDGNINHVSDVTKDVADNDKVRLLVLNYKAGSFTTISGTDICSDYITAAGGINVAADFEGGNDGTGGQTMTVNAEQVVAWAPDIIITMRQDGKDAILADPGLQTIDAVKEGKVFVIPEGTYPWSVRSGEGALMPLWLGKVMYPDLFAELSMEEEVQEFFLEFYDYELTAEQTDTILKNDQYEE